MQKAASTNIGRDKDRPIDETTVLACCGRGHARRDKQTPVLVKADESVSYGRVVTAMVLLQKAGAQKVGFITDPQKLPEDERTSRQPWQDSPANMLSRSRSILLHAIVIGLLAYGFVTLRSRPTPHPQPAIEATVVDERRIAEEAQRLEQEEKERTRQAQEERDQAEQARREREEEQQRLEDLKQQRESEEKARAGARTAAPAGRAGGEAQAPTRSSASSKPRRQPTRNARTLRRERKASEWRKLAQRLAEEERRSAAEDSGQLAQYVAQIQARIQRAWIRPPSAREGLRDASST